MPSSFTPQQIEQFLQEFFDVVGTRQYTGARYVPIFGRAGEDTVEWDDGAPYEPLTVVMHEGVSYVSRRYVPNGMQITDTDYWVETYRFNAQVEQYRQEVLQFQSQIDQIREDMESDYVPFPDPDNYPKYGTMGQVLTTLADGKTMWEDPVVPSDAQAEAVITEWLADHPEATTTVQDGAVTNVKLANDTFKRRTTTDYDPDFNAMVDPGYYGLAGSTTYANAPTDFVQGPGGVLITFKYYPNSTFVSQILINYSPSIKRKMFFRSGSSGGPNPGFAPWCVVEDAGNILSTVDSKINTAVTFTRRNAADYDPDLNDMADAGFYWLAGGTTYANAPTGYDAGPGGVLVSFKYSSTSPYVSQILINYSPSIKRKMFFRSGASGGSNPGFAPWCVVEDTDTVLSTVDSKAVIRRNVQDYDPDLNAMVDAGFYALAGNATYANAPTDYVESGGVLITFKYYATTGFVSQILINYSPTTQRNMFFRSGTVTGSNPGFSPWSVVNPDYPSLIEGNKIALFGDSIMSGTIKTPSSNQTHCVGKYLQQGLKIPVVDGSVGSVGYITHIYLNYNILELVKAVDLSDCKTFVCSAGDNDSQYPIGTYTDTNAGYSDYEASDSGATIMGNVYKMVDYLHTTYPNMSVIIASKTNTLTSGVWPTYRRDITTRVGQLNAELKKFADYYGCGWIDLSSCGMDAWLLAEVLEPDHVHFKDIGYQRVAAYMVGELIKYTGIGNYISNTVPRVTYPSQG